MNNPLSTVEKAMDFADDSFESREEAASTRTRRQEIDMTSPFKLPQLIRPISFIWAMANETILTWATVFVVFFMDKVDPMAANTLMAALAANTGVLGTIVGFYFNGRTREKNEAKKQAAGIQITKEKTKAAVKIEVMKEKALIKQTRKEKRKERKQTPSP